MTKQDRGELIQLMYDEMEYEANMGVVSSEWVLSTLMERG
jgi:hypothetical protein